jgi:competence protein ComEC
VEPSDVPDLRLALPALAAWVVAWRALFLPATVSLGIAVVLVLVGGAALLAARGASPAAPCAAGTAPLGADRGRPRDSATTAGGRVRWASLIAAVGLCAAAASAATGLRVASRTGSPLAALAADRAAVAVTAVLSDDPRAVAAKGPGRQPLFVVRVRVERLDHAGRSVSLRQPLLVLATDPGWLGLLPSQHVRTSGRLVAAGNGDDVAALLSARGPPQVLGRASRLQRLAGRLRAGLRDAADPLPDDEAGLLPGLVVGDTSRQDAGLGDDFRTTGLTHLTAVSGTNVAVLLAAVLLGARRVRLGPRAAPVAAAVALGLFVVLARPSPSVLRATLMGVVGLVALATGGRRRALPSLGAAVLVLVLTDPDLAGQAGFALSVLATGGLLVLGPPWRARLARRLPGWAADALAVPLAAQAACGPVVVALSGQLGLLSVPANLLAAPAVAPATVLGVLAALVAPWCLPLAQLLAWLAWPAVAWLVLVAHTGARMPGAAVGWPDGTRGALLLAVATALLLAAAVRRRLRLALLVSALSCGSVFGGAAVLLPAWPARGWFLVMCDVGQGDALVLSTGPRSAVVVDTGPDPGAVDRCLSDLGVDRVPLVLLTHDHADHVEGLPGVLRGRSVGQVLLGPLDEPAGELSRVQGWTRRARVPLARAALGEVRQAGPLRWQVLAPVRTYRGTDSDPNNNSLVLRLTVGTVSVLLTGDVEPDAQRDLAGRFDLRADVLKVPHRALPLAIRGQDHDRVPPSPHHPRRRPRCHRRHRPAHHRRRPRTPGRRRRARAPAETRPDRPSRLGRRRRLPRRQAETGRPGRAVSRDPQGHRRGKRDRGDADGRRRQLRVRRG